MAEQDVAPDTPSHTPGTPRGEERVIKEGREPGRGDRPERGGQTRDGERHRRRDRPQEEDDAPIIGLGSHVPSFLMRKTRIPTES